jgi:hypothetical protein
MSKLFVNKITKSLNAIARLAPYPNAKEDAHRISVLYDICRRVKGICLYEQLLKLSKIPSVGLEIDA